ncbi:(2Fe-2S)-binding protein [Novosphingobium pentaromativorans US6-1]|nr:(2Fe-2S)-binding protein [Novosphingobium pentaromativorans US6-1]
MREVPFRIDDPEMIPTARYHDEEFYQAELDHLWPRVWQMACRLEQIPNVGDWVEYSNVGKSVIVVRTKDGIRAFHNHCRHRGVPVAGGDGKSHGNCAKTGFICPFHGWRYNMEGKNTFVYASHMFSDEVLNPDALNLIPCRAEIWGGAVFINHDEDAPSFRETMGPLADRMEEQGLSELRAEWWYGTVLPANWKLAMEAFQESYHVLRTHPQLHHAAPDYWNSRFGKNTGGLGATEGRGTTVRDMIKSLVDNYESLSTGMAGLVHQKEVDIGRSLQDIELPEGPEEAIGAWFHRFRAELTEQLRARGEDIPDLNETAERHAPNALDFIFPHYFLLFPLTTATAYRIRPLGPESCYYEIWSLTHYPKGEEPEPLMAPIDLPHDSKDFPLIPQQDYANIPLQQAGTHSTGFEYMRLAKDVEGLISNYQRVIDGYLAGVADDKLAAATRKLSGNFDGPILDLEL